MSTEQVILRLVLAVIVGGIIGAEREYKSKSAGLRTLMLISLGATVFTMLSMKLGGPNSPDRIASNIVTGIGFVGAGVIFKTDTKLSGITTAATIWVTAAIGMAIGAGYELAATIACVCVLGVLLLFSLISRKLEKIAHIKIYTIQSNYSPGIGMKYDKIFTDYKLKVINAQYVKDEHKITGTLTVEGKFSYHQLLMEELFNNQNYTLIEIVDNK